MFTRLTFVLTTSCFYLLACNAQNDTPTSSFSLENFDSKILNYQPPKRPGVSNDDYQRGLTILEETRTATKNNPDNLNAADYWNICVAFAKLREPKAHLEIPFLKGTQDPETFCSYMEAFGGPVFEKELPALSAELLRKCAGIDTEDRSKPQEINSELVNLLLEINRQDQLYRKDEQVDWAKQKVLDRQNQALIDSLYAMHQTYLGTSLVGEEYQFIMWSVIQHADTAMMRRYLPVVQEAVQAGELQEGPLKMLLDRYYALTEGFQLFGTQGGDLDFPIAKETTRQKILQTYSLD